MSGSTEAETAPRRRPRWGLRILVGLAAVAVLVGGAEIALRMIIPAVISNVVRENMGLAADHPVEIELGGSTVLAALGGRVGEIKLTIPDIEVFEGIETELFAQADSVSFDPTQGTIEGALVSATIPSSSLGPLMDFVSNGFVNEGEVRDGEVLLGRTMQMFGYDVHLTAGLALSVQNGDLLIDPTSINAAGFDLTTEQLRPMLGEAAVALLDTHEVCVSDRLPAGVTLTNIELKSTAMQGSVTVTAALDPDLLSNPAKLELGTCSTG